MRKPPTPKITPRSKVIRTLKRGTAEFRIVEVNEGDLAGLLVFEQLDHDALGEPYWRMLDASRPFDTIDQISEGPNKHHFMMRVLLQELIRDARHSR